MHYLNYNGTILPNEAKIISADNRGFRYGDGLFETIRIVNGGVPLANFHFERLLQGMQLLGFEIPVYNIQEYFTDQVLHLAKNNGHLDTARVRLMVFRGEGGLYGPVNHQGNYIIQTWSLPACAETLHEKGLSISIYADARVTYDKFSHLKSNNYLPYLMAALHAQKNQLDDCILLNANGYICDASIANIFVIKDKKLFTPPLTEGCTGGVMRRYLLEKLPAKGFFIFEKTLSIADVMDADELFLSNAIQGIRWVQQFGNRFYSNKETAAIFDTLIREIF